MCTMENNKRQSGLLTMRLDCDIIEYENRTKEIIGPLHSKQDDFGSSVKIIMSMVKIHCSILVTLLCCNIVI